jgi:hypothetical protein
MLVRTAVTPFVLEDGPVRAAIHVLELRPLLRRPGGRQSRKRIGRPKGWRPSPPETGIGSYAHGRRLPISGKLLPHGITVGLHTQFSRTDVADPPHSLAFRRCTLLRC